jgi:hypothetical protein
VADVVGDDGEMAATTEVLGRLAGRS